MFIPSVPEGVRDIRKKMWTGFLIVLLKSQEEGSQNDTLETDFEQEGLPARPPTRGTADTIVTLSGYTVELADTLHQASFNSCSEYTFGTLERHGGVQHSAPWAPQSTPLARPNNWYDAKNITTEEKCTGLDDIQIIYPSSPETL